MINDLKLNNFIYIKIDNNYLKGKITSINYKNGDLVVDFLLFKKIVNIHLDELNIYNFN